MERYNKIIKNSLFNQAINTINEREKTRIFCCHSINHCLDVARIAYIINLENNMAIPKDIIYTTALLHDLGRAYDVENHNNKSAEIARTIMTQCNFSDSEIEQCVNAILNHRKDVDIINNLSDLICKADKLSRQCYSCKAQKECYWSDERRNNNIKY